MSIFQKWNRFTWESRGPVSLHPIHYYFIGVTVHTIKKLARRSLTGLAPWRFWSQARFEMRMIRLRLGHSRLNRQNALVREAMVNVGAGRAGRPGWINIDAFPDVNITFVCDCRNRLPLPNGAARGIFTEHFVEHIDYYSEAPTFFRECFRVLRPGGTLRVVVPDVERYLRAYCDDGWSQLIALRGLQPDLTDPWMRVRLRTKMELVNIVFRQFGEHQFAYDFETMRVVLLESGFSQIECSSHGISREPGMAIDSEVRAHESLYVEATKPLSG